jgi:hypothetical protein
MKKVTMLAVLALCLATVSLSAQTTQAFKDAAFTATTTYNNVNLKCKEYAKALETFVKANATKYSITSYKFYEIKTKNSYPNITHDDYNAAKTAISVNGVHVIAIINGEVFDNHHPKGAVKATWDSKLFCPAGGYPAGFTTTEITNIQTYL